MLLKCPRSPITKNLIKVFISFETFLKKVITFLRKFTKFLKKESKFYIKTIVFRSLEYMNLFFKMY